MFTKMKIKKTLEKNKNNLLKTNESTPLENMMAVRDLLTEHFYFQRNYHTANITFIKNEENNTVTFEWWSNKAKQLKLAKSIYFPSFSFLDYSHCMLGDEFVWQMKLDEYEEFFNNRQVLLLKSFLENDFATTCKKVNTHPDDDVFSLLLIQNAESFQKILSVFKKSMLAHATLTKETVEMFIEILNTFSQQVDEREALIKSEKESELISFSKELKKELHLEVEFQRKLIESSHKKILLNHEKQ